MWFTKSAGLTRARQHNFKRLGSKAQALWHRPPLMPYGAVLSVDPMAFAYAAARASIIGQRLGLRGQLAGLGLAAASLSYLEWHAPGRVRVHKHFHLVKDFVGSSLKGTIGAAMSYLEMQSLGYKWHGHWEDCVAPPCAGPHPDFVFANAGSVCLVDAKGSLSDADQTARGEWKRQVYPNRGQYLTLGGQPTEGRVIATKLSYVDPAELVTAHGSWSTASASGKSAGAVPAAIASIQRGNFIGAFFLVGLPKLAAMLMRTRELGINPGVPHSTIPDQANLFDLDGTEVYLGPSRMVIGSEEAQWALRPYCRRDVVESVIKKFLEGAVDTTIPEFASTLSADRQAGADTAVVSVQSADGVGALFHRIS